MESIAPNEQLKRARMERREDLDALAARTGLRVHHLRAIEEGRFRDLPPGIYGRAAIRSFAAAYGLDVDAVLGDCEPLLAQVTDPIDAMARLRGVAPAPRVNAGASSLAAHAFEPRWRPVAAAGVDGAVAGMFLVVAAGSAALLTRASIAALSRSSSSLFLVALVLGVIYYVWLGGLAGTTIGEYAVGPEIHPRDPRPLTLHAIALRTLAAATADARAIYNAGRWVGRRLTPAVAARSAPPRVLSPSPPPPPGRGEVLT